LREVDASVCIEPSKAQKTDEGMARLASSHAWKLEKVENYARGLLERDYCPRCGAERLCIIVPRD
jgi:hypothetical protein